MTERAWYLAAGGRENDSVQSLRKLELPVANRKKKVTRPVVTNLTATKRKSNPQVAQNVVSGVLDGYADDQRLPPLIMRFLDTHWRSYMKQLYLREGDLSGTWRNALKNTENLTWSLRAKNDDESRRRLYILLPELFQWIHAVLKSQQAPIAEEDTFFAELAQLQVAALHPDTVEAAESATVAKKGLASGSGENPVAPSNDVGAGIEDSTALPDQKILQPEANRTAKESRPKSGPLAGLAIGAYVKFQGKRTTNRVMRLEWISRSASVYLFRDQSNGDALCLTADRCVQCLQERSAVVLS